ncbi:hypothetical protein EVJ50_06525 [Synechococcus sp. RSCCF101]|uniref:hypothetical protein n=1 Tax=Synechococcus sp. RSCCF101 TaxID=2511069 RepID=UPI00124812D9|nr:hypothetical protein [Synechococcus sp. RSCCF101]QEY31946.1 hypothetical protein EVJ50_06525 [Synechococcus sp. RSCCF101]
MRSAPQTGNPSTHLTDTLAMKWQDNGELCPLDRRALVERLSRFESASHGEELERLSADTPAAISA